MARIKKVSDRPVLHQLYDQPWPPGNGRGYIESEAFGSMLVELVERFIERYSHMDFSSALRTSLSGSTASSSAIPIFSARGDSRHRARSWPTSARLSGMRPG